MTQSPRVSQVPSIEPSLFKDPEIKRNLYKEGFSHSLQAAATKFKKLCEPKVAKFKEAIPPMLAWHINHG